MEQPAVEPKSRARIKVLVVEDHPSTRRLISHVLKKLGFETILEAAEGSAALQVMSREDIGLLITDIDMDGMDGIDLVYNVRRLCSRDDCGVIVLSGVLRTDVLSTANTYGADHFLYKPLKVDELEKCITDVMAKLKY